MKFVRSCAFASAAAALLCLPLLGGQSLALDFGPKKSGDPCNVSGIKPESTLGKLCAAQKAKAQPASASGGAANQMTAGATAGSSEHSSVRGTINGGGDFIAPKLQETPPPKPRGVAPKAK